MDFLSEINLMMMIQYNTILFWLKICQGATWQGTHTQNYCNMAPKAGLHNMEFKNEEIIKLTFVLISYNKNSVKSMVLKNF